MTTIAQFSKPEDAHLLRLRLEAGGITAYVQDENIVQMDWMLSNAVGGVRVEVADGDAAQAEAILHEEPEPLPGEHPMCPKCSSLNTAPDDSIRRFNYFTMLLGMLFFHPGHRWRCGDCGEIWDERKRPAAHARGG